MKNFIEQKIEDGKQNINIAEQNVYNGISIEAAMKLCFDLFNENFPKLQEEAHKTAEKYMQDNCKDIMTYIINEKNVDFNKFNRPDCQNILYKILVHQACYNEKEKNKILSDLLINKLKNDINTDKQIDIILDKSIEISTQLSLKHIDILSFIFLTQNVVITTIQFTNESFVDLFNNVVTVFKLNDNINQSDIDYLISQNCLQLSIAQYPDEFAKRYNLDLQYLKENLNKLYFHIPSYRITSIARPIVVTNVNNKLNASFDYKLLL